MFFLLSNEEDCAGDGVVGGTLYYFSRMVFDEVNVGPFRAGDAVVGAVPTFGEAVEGTDSFAPTVVDGDRHLVHML